MRLVKLSYLSIIVAAWWLTANGYFGAPVSRHWVVILIGLSLGFVFGCVDSRHVCHLNYGNAFWIFIWDAGFVLIACTIVWCWQLDKIGPAMAWLPLSMTGSFVFFAWPRYLTNTNPGTKEETDDSV